MRTTVTRVNGRGRETGETDLSVDRGIGYVEIKLGMLRVRVRLEAWFAIIRETTGETND